MVTRKFYIFVTLQTRLRRSQIQDSTQSIVCFFFVFTARRSDRSVINYRYFHESSVTDKISMHAGRVSNMLSLRNSARGAINRVSLFRCRPLPFTAGRSLDTSADPFGLSWSTCYTGKRCCSSSLASLRVARVRNSAARIPPPCSQPT